MKTGQKEFTTTKALNNDDNNRSRSKTRSKTSMNNNSSIDIGIIDQNNNQRSQAADGSCMSPSCSSSFPYDFGLDDKQQLTSPTSSSTNPAQKFSSRSKSDRRGHNQKPEEDRKTKLQDHQEDQPAQNLQSSAKIKQQLKKIKKMSKEKYPTPYAFEELELLLSKPPSPLKSPLTSTKEDKTLERKKQNRETLHAKSIRKVLEWDYQPEASNLQFIRSRPNTAAAGRGFGVPLASRFQVLPNKQLAESNHVFLKGNSDSALTLPTELPSQSHVPFLRPTTPCSSTSNNLLQSSPSQERLKHKFGQFTFSKEKLLEAVKQQISTPPSSSKGSQSQFDTNSSIYAASKDYRHLIPIPHTPIKFYTKPAVVNPVYYNYWEACKKLCPELYEEDNKPANNNDNGIPIEITRTISNSSKALEGKRSSSSAILYRGGNAVVVNYIHPSSSSLEEPTETERQAQLAQTALEGNNNLKRTGTANVNSGLNQKIHELRKKINILKVQKPKKEEIVLEKGVNQKRKFEQRLMDIELQRICLLTEKLDAEVTKSVLEANKKVQAQKSAAAKANPSSNNEIPTAKESEVNIDSSAPTTAIEVDNEVEYPIKNKFKIMRPMSPYYSVKGSTLSSQVEAKNQARQRRQAQLIEQYNQRMANLKNNTKNESTSQQQQQTVWNSARSRVNPVNNSSATTKTVPPLKIIYGSPVTKIPERTYGYQGQLQQRSMNQALKNHHLYNSITNAKSSYSRDSLLKDYKKHEAYATYGEEVRAASRTRLLSSTSATGSYKRQVSSWVHN